MRPHSVSLEQLASNTADEIAVKPKPRRLRLTLLLTGST